MSRQTTDTGTIRHTNSQGSDNPSDVVENNVINGAYQVTTSTGSGVPTDREMGAVNTRVSDTWTEDEDGTRIVITAIGDDGVAANESCVVCFDAPDDATAVTWLTGNATAGEPTMRRVITVGEPREYVFKNPLRRIDAIDLIGTITNVFIEAGK